MAIRSDNLIPIHTDKLSPYVERVRTHLLSRVIGQDRAIEHIVRNLNIVFGGLHGNDEKPIGQLFFLGPTGSGKSFSAKETARALLNAPLLGPPPITIVQCNTFQEPHSISSLTGSPPGYIGYGEMPILSQLSLEKFHFFLRFEAMIEEAESEFNEGKEGPVIQAFERIFHSIANRKNVVSDLRVILKKVKSTFQKASRYHGMSHLDNGMGRAMQQDLESLLEAFKAEFGPLFSVVLFDEIERAHPDIWQLLLGIFQDGVLQLKTGEITNFQYSIIFLTSNTGSQDIQKLVGRQNIGFHQQERDGPEALDEAIYREGKRAMEKMFPPEFIGRIKDDIVVFRILDHESLTKILDNMLEEFRARFSGAHPELPILSFRFGNAFKDFLLQRGESKKYGARELEGVVKKYVRSPLAVALSTGQVISGDSIHFEIEDGEPVLLRKKRKSGRKKNDQEPHENKSHPNDSRESQDNEL